MKEISFFKPDITEAEVAEVSKTLLSGWITTGPRTKILEKKLALYLGTGKVVCLNSATAAMELTLRILGIGEGDEVITSAYTYTASASVIDHVGAKIVLVDTQKDSFEMDYEALGKKITNKTKAIIPVDIGGVMCDYDKLYEVLNEHADKFVPKNDIQGLVGRIVVVADSAHGLGAKYKGKNSGQVGDFTCFSFHAVKNYTTAEGGCVTWRGDLGVDSEQMYKEYMLYSLHGQSKDALSKTKVGSWEYDIKYLGYKCNMTDLCAGLGLVQLERYDELLRIRKKLIGVYNEELEVLDGTVLKHYTENGESSGHLYLIRIRGINEKERNEIIEAMARLGISCNVHYKPLPLFSAYKSIGFDIKDFPNAYKQYENLITLPLYTLLEEDDIRYIGKTLLSLLNNRGGIHVS